MTNTALPTVPNAKRLLAAGFTAILAAGVGFAIRGGIFDNWSREFGFTGAQLGSIGFALFIGFCFGIIIGGICADKIGYAKLVIAAFVLHVLSAIVAISASSPTNAFDLLFWGSFLFGLANGTLEAVANPLIATLFPKNRAHYLNILHASWPAGMILGTVLGWVLDDKMHVSWKIQLGLFLIPTAVYGMMFVGQKMPKSEASATGVKLGDMFKDVGLLGGLVVCYLLSLFFASVLPKGLVGDHADLVGYIISGILLLIVGIITRFSLGSFLLFVLFVTHALIGSVELGTDGWIQNITGNIFTSAQGKWLFVWTSVIMFSLRFCTHFIQENFKLSPIGLLLVSSIIACIGLNLASGMDSIAMAFVALGIYAVGKSFFWPTMLAVASDRFPRTGAIAISIMGGIGMMSVGMIGGPGLGYLKDRYSSGELSQANPALYNEYKAATPSTFLNLKGTAVNGLDGIKLGGANERLAAARTAIEAAKGDPATALASLSTEDQTVIKASIRGDRHTLKTDAIIPAIMAAIFLLLFIYFKSIGGYRVLHLGDER